MKPTHGGTRPGAGRPKAATRKVNLTVSLPPANKARIDAKARANGVSSSELVKRWSDRLPNDPKHGTPLETSTNDA